jgi:hypothetical protein
MGTGNERRRRRERSGGASVTIARLRAQPPTVTRSHRAFFFAHHLNYRLRRAPFLADRSLC